MEHENTPSVASSGSTTVWVNGPVGPPEIGEALVELSRTTHDINCLCEMCDLDVCVKLSCGEVIRNITFACQKGDSTEIRTEEATRHVVTTHIVELEYLTFQ